MDDGAAPQASGRGRGAAALVVTALVAVAVVAIFWGRGRKPTPMTPTLEHLASIGARRADTCLTCHRPDGPAANRPAGHTPRQDCWNCHVVGGG
jgi:hypothetical protein